MTPPRIEERVCDALERIAAALEEVATRPGRKAAPPRTARTAPRRAPSVEACVAIVNLEGACTPFLVAKRTGLTSAAASAALGTAAKRGLVVKLHRGMFDRLHPVNGAAQ